MKRLIRTVALVSAMSMLVGGTVFATSSKMVTSFGSAVTSEAAFASSTGATGSYEFKPNTNKTLTGSIREYYATGLKGDVVASKKYSTKTTGSFYQKENYSYKVRLSGGEGYGVVTVQ